MTDINQVATMLSDRFRKIAVDHNMTMSQLCTDILFYDYPADYKLTRYHRLKNNIIGYLVDSRSGLGLFVDFGPKGAHWSRPLVS